MDPRPRAARNGGLQQLQSLFFPSPLEPLYVSIDFERAELIVDQFRLRSDTQVGISILDTRDLNLLPRDKLFKLTTYNLVTGSESYYAASASNYLWGTSEKILPCHMLTAIEKHVDRRDRNIILVGHGFSSDLAALRALGFNFEASVIGILDTSNIANELQMQNFSLVRLLDKLKCPHARLYNAGNDAHFTLRALILLAIKGHEKQDLVNRPQVEEERAVVERVEALRALALTSLPIPGPRIGEKKQIHKIHIAGPKTRKKRVAKGDSTTTRSLEKQEEIREERRQKRIMTVVGETSPFCDIDGLAFMMQV